MPDYETEAERFFACYPDDEHEALTLEDLAAQVEGEWERPILFVALARYVAEAYGYDWFA